MRFKFTLSHTTIGFIATGPIGVPTFEPPSGFINAGIGGPWTPGPPAEWNTSVNGNGGVTDYLLGDFLGESGVQYNFHTEVELVYPGLPGPLDFTVRVMLLDASLNILAQEDFVYTTYGTKNEDISLTPSADCVYFGITCINNTPVNTKTINLNVANFIGIDDPGGALGPIVEKYEISEPDGWKYAVLKLARDKDFFSLIEFFDGSFIFYGSNGVKDGGLHHIEKWEQLYGPDVVINILIEFSQDDYDFIQVFYGQLDVSLCERQVDNKMRVPIIRDDFWAKFYNRKEFPVNLTSVEDQDGEIIIPVQPVDITLITQKIRYKGEYRWQESVTYPDLGASIPYFGMQLDWDQTVTDDLRKFNLPRVPINISRPGGLTVFGEVYNLPGLFEAPWDGDYTFDLQLYQSEYIPLGNSWFGPTGGSAMLFIQRTDQTVYDPADAATNTVLTFGTDTVTRTNLVKTLRLRKGDQIAIWQQRSPSTKPYTIFGERRMDWKADVNLATNSNITLFGEQMIDGTMTGSSLVLVKNQGDPSENGIYVSTTTGWLRRADTDTSAELINAAVYVTGGTANQQTAWRQVEESPTIGIDANTWVYTQVSDERFKEYPGPEFESYLNITADTVFKNNISEGFLTHDVAAGIINAYGLGEDNPFYSEILGSSLTNARQYEDDGCIWNHLVTKGLQLKGYLLSEKSNSMSFMDWWNGMRPIFNLGLSYDRVRIDGEFKNVIRTEGVEHFYDENYVVRISNIRTITRKYDTSKLYNKISIGYREWQAEDTSGIDDPQTKRTYTTRFQKIGQAIEIYSDFIAASLAIEATRRQSINKTTDYRFDNNNFIIAIDPLNVSPDSFVPDFLKDFDMVTGLLNAETRYNAKLTPGRNFLRFRKWFNGGLQAYQDSVYKWVYGEGNYDMQSDMKVTGCLDEDFDGENFSEKQNIAVTDDFIHTAYYYEIECPLALVEYLTIARNRKKAIGISISSINHVAFFIEELDFKPVLGTCTISGWSKKYIDITVIEGPAPTQECNPIVECDFVLTDNFGAILTDETGACLVYQ